jgi:hypothetical protein
MRLGIASSSRLGFGRSALERDQIQSQDGLLA